MSCATICGAACITNADNNLTSGLMFAGRSHSTGANKQGSSCMYASGNDPVGVNSINNESSWKTYGMNSEIRVYYKNIDFPLPVKFQ